MTRKLEDPAAAVGPRPSTAFLGLAAALAFIAVAPSAAAVTEGSVDQYRRAASSPEEALSSSSVEAGTGGSFRLAQSTQCANPGSPDCDDEDGYDDEWSNDSGGENPFDPFHYEYLPADHGFFDGVDLQDGFWYQVQLDNFNQQSGPPYESRMTTALFGPKGVGLPCLGRGGAIMFSVKTRTVGCWRPAKAPPVRGLKVPKLGPAAQRALAGCRLSTGSVTLRKGAFACIATPRAVVGMAAKGARGKGSPVRRG